MAVSYFFLNFLRGMETQVLVGGLEYARRFLNFLRGMETPSRGRRRAYVLQLPKLP